MRWRPVRTEKRGSELSCIACEAHADELKKRTRNINFTAYRSKAVNDAIASDLEFIAGEILTRIHDVQAIVLVGGFAKEEGSVNLGGKRTVPLNDYDLLTITRRPHRRFRSAALDKFAQSLSIHLDIELFWLPLLGLVEDRLDWYDVKFASKVIYGDERVLNLIPLEPGESPPPREGMRLLFHRMAGLIEFFDPRLPTGRSNDRYEALVYNSAKAIMACCESLLMLRGEWRPSCMERARFFSQTYQRRFRDLAESLPSLPQAVAIATRFKLYPSFDVYSSPIDLWFEAREYVRKVILYYWSELYRRKTDSEIAFVDDVIGKSRFALTDYLMFHLQYAIERKRLCLRGLVSTRRMLDYLLAGTFLLLDSAKENGNIDVDLVARARRFVESFFPVPSYSQVTPQELWCSTRDAIFEALRYVRR